MLTLLGFDRRYRFQRCNALTLMVGSEIQWITWWNRLSLGNEGPSTSQQRILQTYLNWWQLNSSARSSSSSAVSPWIALLIIALLIICGRVQTHLLRLGLCWVSPSLSEGEMQSQGRLRIKEISVWLFNTECLLNKSEYHELNQAAYF